MFVTVISRVEKCKRRLMSKVNKAAIGGIPFVTNHKPNVLVDYLKNII